MCVAVRVAVRVVVRVALCVAVEFAHPLRVSYGVASVSKIDRIMGLFCKRDL